jgi:4-diphosphocytidyl-2-C-methyl-D-erythritol kinase
MKTITLQSPAKLNLYLKVVNKRPDGFHDLVTLFERIDLADEIVLKVEPSGCIRVSCDHPHVPTGPKNLVYKVADILRKDFGITRGVHIIIRKNIPVAAGLAGGSSNAATVLQGLNKLWDLGLSRDELVQYAARIGSDVAFFLYDCSWALGTGRGERIKTLKIPSKLWHVLVVPRVKMLTKRVFGALNLKLTKSGPNVNILTRYLGKSDVRKVGSLLWNDLEQPIGYLEPKLLRVKKKLLDFKTAGVAFSGSGPSLFTVVESKKQADEIRSILKRRFSQVFVVRTH